MKTITTIICLAAALSTYAQEPETADTLNQNNERVEVDINTPDANTTVVKSKNDSTASDTTRIELKNAYITIVSKNKKSDDSDWDSDDDDDDDDDNPKYQLTWWNGFDIGVNGLLGKDRDFNLNDESFLEPDYGKSRYISANFGQVKGRLIKDYVGFTTGFTVQIYNFKYDGDNEFAFAGDSLFSVPTGDKNVTKNKLRASYIGIPLMLEFNTSLNPDKSFHISAGVLGKVRIENMYKQKYSFDGNDNKATLKGDLGLNRWGADAMLRVGYRKLTLFAQVGLLPMFDNDNTGDVYPFAAGFFIKV